MFQSLPARVILYCSQRHTLLALPPCWLIALNNNLRDIIINNNNNKTSTYVIDTH